MGNIFWEFIEVLLPLFLFLWWSRRVQWGQYFAPHLFVLWGMIVLKTFVSIIYLEWHHRTLGVCDSDAYLRTIRIFNSALPDHPGHFLQFLMNPGGEYLPPDLWYYIKHTRFWSNKGMMFFIKILSGCSILGQGKLVWILLWYNIVAMLGPVYLLNTFANKFNLKRSWLWLIPFLLPQVLFWGSGLHKEALIITLQCFVIGAYLKLELRRFSWAIIKQGALYTFLIAWSVLLLMRGFDAVVLLLVLSFFFAKKGWVLLYSFVGLFVLLYVSEWMQLGFGNYLVQKQQAYLHNGVVVSVQQVLELDGHSIWSFVRNMPMAVEFALLGRAGLPQETMYFLLQVVEVLFLIILMIRQVCQEWIWRFISIALLQMTIIGWVVTNQGSVVRYAAVPWFWLAVAISVLLLSVKKQEKEV